LQRQLLAKGYRLPIVFVSAFPETKTRGDAIASGALGFLNKPFREESLIACLNEALSSGKARS
jgi:FixJ family two-component response regulator